MIGLSSIQTTNNFNIEVLLYSMRVVVLQIRHKAKQYQIEQRNMFSSKLLVNHNALFFSSFARASFLTHKEAVPIRFSRRKPLDRYPPHLPYLEIICAPIVDDDSSLRMVGGSRCALDSEAHLNTYASAFFSCRAYSTSTGLIFSSMDSGSH